MYVKISSVRDCIEISPYIPPKGKEPYLIIDGLMYMHLVEDYPKNQAAIDHHFYWKFGLTFSHVYKLVSRLRKRK